MKMIFLICMINMQIVLFQLYFRQRLLMSNIYLI
ncbi:Uncharacterised protein [Mycobacterium tuberculosis]|nr:Uncharacterised protein [Mycobacterium tuberculosis]